MLRKKQLKDIFLFNDARLKNDSRCLPNNRRTAVKISAKQEESLIKTGHIDFYNSEIQKYLDRVAAVRLSKEEMDQWKIADKTILIFMSD